MPIPRASLLALLIALAVPAAAQAGVTGSAPDAGTAFAPTPVSQPLYGTIAPSANPTLQQHIVTAHDGIDLYVETWLPKQLPGGPAVPAKIPTVLIMTPYVQQGEERYPSRNLADTIDWFTARGYAVAQNHVRGTGLSGGCIEQTSVNQIDDGARVVEYLGRDAPWTNGAVGMYGHSYDAETQYSVAGRGDPAMTKYLKAIVPSASVAGQYEYSNLDGVPFAGQAAESNADYLALVSVDPGTAPVNANTFQRAGCQPEIVAGSTDYSGDLTPFWQVREYRPGAPKIKAAVLEVHGLDDPNVLPITESATFSRIPASTPHKGLFGIWEHNFPDVHAGVEPQWARADFLTMVTAWYDQYLKGESSGVTSWPDVQLQSPDGQWRAEPSWPETGGPAGQLALASGGVMGGVASPAGSDSFTEGADDMNTVPGTSLTFETPKVKAPLEVAGMPIADLWLETSMPDAHITGRLEVLDADGRTVTFPGSSGMTEGTFGARSLRHLEPMPDGYFVQTTGRAAPTNTPIRVPLRFIPTDMIVPAGGRLRVVIAGATTFDRMTLPSGNASTITILHDCTHTSALRFLMPHADAPLINPRETDEKGTLASSPAVRGDRSGGGLATAPACGKAPERPFNQGNALPASPTPTTTPGETTVGSGPIPGGPTGPTGSTGTPGGSTGGGTMTSTTTTTTGTQTTAPPTAGTTTPAPATTDTTPTAPPATTDTVTSTSTTILPGTPPAETPATPKGLPGLSVGLAVPHGHGTRRVHVSGRAAAATRVTVVLRRNGKVLATRKVRADAGGRYRVDFHVGKAGKYTARVSVPAGTTSTSAVTSRTSDVHIRS